MSGLSHNAMDREGLNGSGLGEELSDEWRSLFETSRDSGTSEMSLLSIDLYISCFKH